MGRDNYEEVDLSQTGGRIVGTYSGRLTKIEFANGEVVEGRIFTERKYVDGQWQEIVFLGKDKKDRREINPCKVRELRVYMGVEKDEIGIGASSLDAFLSEAGIGV